jgi:protein phosphatase
MKVHYGALTDVGRQRQVNQDYWGASEPDAHHQSQLLVVCDGMGGHSAGDVASRLGVDTILQLYADAEELDAPALLDASISQANTQIYEKGQGLMGTTCVAALVVEDTLYIANVGDSRAYMVRESQIEQISRDHSFVEEQVEAGVMTPEQARQSGYRNMITRALGHKPDVQVDIFTRQVQPDDVVLLCSDGLHNMVDSPELAEAVSSMAPEEAVHYLIDLANDRGGSDNITAVVVRLKADDASGDDPNAVAPTRPLSPATRPAPDTVPAVAAPASATTPAPNTMPAEAAPPAAPARSNRPVAAVVLVVVVLLLVIGWYGANASGLLPATLIEAPTTTATSTVTPTATPTVTPTAPATATPTPTTTAMPDVPVSGPPTDTPVTTPSPESDIPETRP